MASQCSKPPASCPTSEKHDAGRPVSKKTKKGKAFCNPPLGERLALQLPLLLVARDLLGALRLPARHSTTARHKSLACNTLCQYMSCASKKKAALVVALLPQAVEWCAAPLQLLQALALRPDAAQALFTGDWAALGAPEGVCGVHLPPPLLLHHPGWAAWRCLPSGGPATAWEGLELADASCRSRTAELGCLKGCNKSGLRMPAGVVCEHLGKQQGQCEDTCTAWISSCVRTESQKRHESVAGPDSWG